MVWYGMVWYGMVWYGMVWYGMVWYEATEQYFPVVLFIMLYKVVQTFESANENLV